MQNYGLCLYPQMLCSCYVLWFSKEKKNLTRKAFQCIIHPLLLTQIIFLQILLLSLGIKVKIVFSPLSYKPELFHICKHAEEREFIFRKLN